MYKRKCDFSGQDIISMYPPNSPFKVYAQDVWWSDCWDGLEYGRDFDFSRPFFEQFRELQLEVPRLALVNKRSENAKFTNHAANNKNCYLSSCVFDSEDIYYSDWVVDHSRDLVDCSYMHEGSELCYETYYAWGAYWAFFSEFIKRCENVWFCYDCMHCKDCFLCTNVRNKQYCFENEQLSQEEYEKRVRDIFPLSASVLQEYRRRYSVFKEQRAIHPAVYQVQSVNSTGDLLFYCKNAKQCFDCIEMEDSHQCVDTIQVKDSFGLYHVGWAELMYESHAIANGYMCLFCHFTYDNKNVTYCDGTQNSKNLFGCVGLNKKEYCIFNKQYDREEFERLSARIVEHMRKDGSGGEATGSWGEFFPMEFSPFAYNQSRAPEYYPITKEMAKQKRIPWSDYESPPLDVPRVIAAKDLPEHIADIPADVLGWAITCEVSGVPFQVIKKEYDFYKQLQLPVPRRHPNQRYLDRMAMRNPRKLWHRTCAKCQKGITTSYSPNRPEVVYCERCYLEAVY